MPGFRKGKVPPQMVIQRIGREAVVEQAVRDSLPEWYEGALLDAGINAIGDPEGRPRRAARRGRGAGLLDRGLRAAEGGARRVPRARGRPRRGRGARRGRRVGARAPSRGVREPLAGRAPRRLRRRAADRLRGHGSTASRSRAARPRTSSSSSAASGLLPEFDAGLAGAGQGEERDDRGHVPRGVTSPPSSPASRPIFHIAVKEVREKNLPELDDEFASEASEFETLAELSDHIRGRIAEAFERRADAEFRERAVDVAARGGEARAPEGARPRPRPPDVGADRAAAREPRDRPSDVRADAGQGPPRPDRRRRGGRREGAAARGRARGGRRGRGDRADRRRPDRGDRAGRGQEQPREAARPARARRAATRCSATRSGCARPPS